MWVLFLYRLPSEPSRPRVAVWRELRRLGALPLSQGVVAVPDLEHYTATLDQVAERIAREGGTYYRFPLGELDGEQRQRLETEWFNAPGRKKAEQAIATCGKALEDFVERVYQAEAQRGSAIIDPPEELPWGASKKRKQP
jgi:hypothetical protein